MQRYRILLADDHAVVRAGISNALKELPELEIVGEVSDGRAVWAALAETRPDALLIDVVMPNFEPLPAIKRIRELYPALKILIISAHDDDIYVQGLLATGVDGYHLKDQPLSDLRLAVQQVLAGRRWISHVLLDRLLPRPGAARPPLLTLRQRELLALLQQGYDNQTIALHLGLSIKTIENHLTRLYRQLNVQSRLEAVRYAQQHAAELALAEWTAHAAPGRAEPFDDHQRIRILLVDDNARYRRQLQRMVGKITPQAVIYEAETTRAALLLLDELPLQLALVDVVLGDEDGIRCTQLIKARAPRMRVVLMSAYPDREFRQRGLAAGASAFLDKKDVDVATLRQVLADIM